MKIELHHDGRLRLCLTSESGTERHVLVGANEAGAKAIVRILMARQNGERTFNTAGSPTQAEVDRMVQEFKSREIEKARTELEEMGIDFNSIQL